MTSDFGPVLKSWMIS